MGNEDRHSTIQDTSRQRADRYQPALAYIELDRTHRKRSRWSAILAVSVLVLLASLAMLAVIGFSYFQGQMKNNQIAEHADLADIAQDLDGTSFSIDWEALEAINPDTVAWLYVPGTAINYPVVRGKDNDYYLSHDFTGEQGWLAQFGSIFLDWRNNPNWSDQAYFIYGHHMNDGSMFADIARLSDQARFDASRTVYLLSPNGNFRLRTFSLIHCSSDDPLVQITFANSQEFAAYLQDKMNRSIVNVADAPAADSIEKSFAFATCDNYSSGRYVLYAYVEQETGGATSTSSSVGTPGASSGRIDDILSDPASSADVERSSSQFGRTVDARERDATEAGLREDSRDDEAQEAQGQREEVPEESEDSGDDGVSVGEYGEYEGGYYTYDDDGELVWVPTDE